MPQLKFILPAVILLGGMIVSTTTSFGKVEYTKKEKKACAVCHVKASSKELNKVGECYKTNNHSLQGCEEKK
jgi:hypothetical protein